ncbi:MAG: 3-ketoacyl-ACP reductase [Kaistia sp. SCN 65-12]|nr:MAG: 3-ketoacyl-ACP reductase [Kaistia sp. SCN 65-12]
MGNAMPLSGRHALITGGLGTIGRAMAKAFVAAGAEVTILDRPGAEPTPGLGWLGVDLNDLAGAEAAVAAIDRPVDILVNNAALIINKPHDEFSLQEYEDQIRVNSSAAFALTRVCAAGMKARQWGRVLNLTSITLNGQWDGYVPYVASKGAMLGLTKAFARELGKHGITVNAISPGAVVSEAEDRVFADRLQEFQDWVLKQQSLKSRVQPEDIADLAVFLSSDAARMISGQNISVDGGW